MTSRLRVYFLTEKYKEQTVYETKKNVRIRPKVTEKEQTSEC